LENFEFMEQIIMEYIVSLGLSVPIAILVGVRAGRGIHHINAIQMEEQLSIITIDALKEQIIYQLSILLKVYKDTTEGVHLPAGVNLQEVSTHLFFFDEKVNVLNSIHSDLIAHGTESAYFGQLIQFLTG
jgi:hypothetical protein